jgi:hypothetical protein
VIAREPVIAVIPPQPAKTARSGGPGDRKGKTSPLITLIGTDRRRVALGMVQKGGPKVKDR